MWCGIFYSTSFDPTTPQYGLAAVDGGGGSAVLTLGQLQLRANDLS